MMEKVWKFATNPEEYQPNSKCDFSKLRRLPTHLKFQDQLIPLNTEMDCTNSKSISDEEVVELFKNAYIIVMNDFLPNFG